VTRSSAPCALLTSSGRVAAAPPTAPPAAMAIPAIFAAPWAPSAAMSDAGHPALAGIRPLLVRASSPKPSPPRKSEKSPVSKTDEANEEMMEKEAA
jgi:hypothetical protein